MSRPATPLPASVFAAVATAALAALTASVFTLLRMDGTVSWQWQWVLSPLWIRVLLVLAGMAVALARSGNDQE